MVLSNDKLKKRIEKLRSNFSYYIDKFDSLNQFTGPSLYFHFKTLNKLRAYKKLEELFDDNLFFEYLYATLTSWGLHRMGPKGAKLADFKPFKINLQQQKKAILELQNKNILKITNQEIPIITNKIWNIIDSIVVSTTRTKLIAGSKALHHILPEIIPPIDRQYTVTFFHGSLPQGQDERIFRKIYPYFCIIGLENKSEIESFIGINFHTSETKVIDNAIVGFVLTELNTKNKDSE